MSQNKILRCAVYTRKSTEEGLEQEFNSLQAQREACEAYITSQKHEGWQIINSEYDDGGISGGTMERPGLRRLLEDIQKRKVDIIVVYKVDRLTRSLSDFAKMVEIFDTNSVSFVSVTQQFNTTSSMGRLTLNVLLSFAQFEREVTGERIRDKIAASKKKGMWMGGTLPTGYDVKDRKLLANQEKELVQYIFQRYLELGCVRLVKEDLEANNKRVFSRGTLYSILANPIYIGQIRHKGILYSGQHESIIDQELWNQVHNQLQNNGSQKLGRPKKTSPNILIGKLFDDAGKRLTPTGNAKRYRYYMSLSYGSKTADQIDSGWRLPANEIEQTIIQAAQKIVSDKSAVTSALKTAGVATYQIPQILAMTRKFSGNIIDLVKRVDIQRSGLRLTISLASLLPPSASEEAVSLPIIIKEIPMQIKRRGVEMKLVIEAPGTSTRTDTTLIRAITRAHQWFEELASGEVKTIAEIAKREKKDERNVARTISLAFLAPEIVESIISGTQPADMTTDALMKRTNIPLGWSIQKQYLGFSA